MDPELIATIEGTVYEIWRTKERIRTLSSKGQSVPDYLKGYLRRLDRNLNQMRSVAVYYKEYSSIENLQLLGENYIKQMKRDLTPLTFVGCAYTTGRANEGRAEPDPAMPSAAELERR